MAGSILTMATSAFAAAPEAAYQGIDTTSEEVSVTRAYEYEWRYKKGDDGYAYKRLWNCTLARWEGD